MDDIKKLASRDPAVAALLRKATGPSAGQERGKREEGGTTPTRTELTSLASARIRTIRNSEKIFQALPELETIITIAVSTLLSTKDLINTSIVYDSKADIPLDLLADLIENVRDFNDHERGLPGKLYNWMYDAYRSKGATPVLFISDAGFDELFKLEGVKPDEALGVGGLDAKVAQESTRRTQRFANYFEAQQGHLGFIDKSDKPLVGLESILRRKTSKPAGPQKLNLDLSELFESGKGDTLTLTVTDNARIYLAGEAFRRVAHENARSSLYGQLEQTAYEQVHGGLAERFDGDKFQDANDKKQKWMNISDLNETYRTTPEQMAYAEIPSLSITDENHLEFTERVLPAESTLPVIIAGMTQDPIGYLGIIDEMGNFINTNSSLYGDANFMNYLNNDGASDSVVNRANLGMGNGQKVTPEISNRLTARFGELAEGQLADALSQALGGAELDIGITEMFSRVVLTRHLAKRYTQVVYIPAANLCYFATDFDDNGIGVSITERSFVISTIRMALLFAQMNAAVLNSSRHMQYDIQLSPDAMNGKEAVDRIKSDILNSYNRRMPMWGNMEDAWAMGANAGISFNVEGNEYYQSHKVSVSDNTPDYKEPDMDFDKELLRRTCQIANVDPDLVLTPDAIEFASQIYSKSLLVTQQIYKKQEILKKPMTKYVVNGCLASPRLQSRMIETIANFLKATGGEKNAVELTKEINEILRKFINGLAVSLPPPDTSAASSQMDLFDKRVEFFDKLADMVVTEDLTNSLNNAGIKMDANDMKTMVKTYYVRQWLRKQGIENDFFDLVYDKDTREDTIQAISNEVKDATEFLMGLANRAAGKIDTVAKQKGDPNGGGFDGGGGGDGDFGSDDDGLGGDNEFGDDDLGGDEGDTGGGDGDGLGGDGDDGLGGDGDSNDGDGAALADGDDNAGDANPDDDENQV